MCFSTCWQWFVTIGGKLLKLLQKDKHVGDAICNFIRNIVEQSFKKIGKYPIKFLADHAHDYIDGVRAMLIHLDQSKVFE